MKSRCSLFHAFIPVIPANFTKFVPENLSMMNIINLPELPLTDPIQIFLIVLLIILCAPILNRIKIPHIIGLILAGMVLGPFALNILDNDKSFELFGQVGILYIMFQAGLEIDLNTLKQNKNRSIMFGIYTFVIPMVLGTLSCMYLLKLNFIRSLLVSSMYASHTLIAYPIVGKMGIAKNRAVGITVAGTIITVTASLLVLAAIVALTKGEMDSIFWMKFGIGTIIFSLVVFLFLPWLSRLFLSKFHDNIAQYIFVLAVVFFASLCAQAVGLEGILGAFFAGLILNRLIPSISPLANRIEFVGNAIFIPFFLISIGMQINLLAFISSTEALIASAVMTIVATSSKWLSAKLLQKTTSMTKVEGDLIFGLSNGQAAATLAAAMIGYNIGLINDNILNGTIVMILITCTISSVVTEKAARKIATEESNQEKREGYISEERILIPISNPQTMPMLLDMSNLLKQRKNHNALYALKIGNPDDDNNRRLMESAAKLVASTDNTLNCIIKNDVNISNCILNTVHEQNISDILVGIHQKANIVDTFLGSTLSSLISCSPHQTLFVYKAQHPINIIKRLIVAVPDRAEYEPGFAIWFDRLNNLASQLSVEMLFYSGKNTAKAIESLHAQYQSLSISYKELTSWEDFPNIAKGIKKQDMLAIVTARKSTLSYNPLFDKIPYHLNKSFTEQNLILIYPKQTAEESFVDSTNYNTLKI